MGGDWKQWWRRFLSLSTGRYRRARELLKQRYLEELRHAERLREHAARMQYPQFRQKLLDIAAEETKHAEWIAARIRLLGGEPPPFKPPPVSGRNSWQYLLLDLEEEGRCGARLQDEIRTLEPELPEIGGLLDRIRKDDEKHRQEIREMLMRSDPQALWPA
ncbi:MAG TPA: ferritin-like domain-containing protein [candidate division Zixibacteria bacterium]|nr:ferritin-like domain-containing protein [candidate division Zixibacteria bacterium]